MKTRGNKKRVSQSGNLFNTSENMATYNLNGQQMSLEEAVQHLLAEKERSAPTPPTQDKHSIIASLNLLNQIPCFDGENNTNIVLFLEQVQRCARLSKWDDETTLEILEFKITGTAKTFYNTQKSLLTREGKVINFDSISKLLLNRYHQEQTPLILLRQITNMQASPDDSVEKIADKLRHLHALISDKAEANPKETLQTVLNKVTTDTFIRLLPPNLRNEVRTKLPDTLDSALQYTTALREIKAADTAPSVFAVTPSTPVNTNSILPPSPCKYCGAMHFHSQCSIKNRARNNTQYYNTQPNFNVIKNRPCRHCSGPHFDRHCTVSNYRTRTNFGKNSPQASNFNRRPINYRNQNANQTTNIAAECVGMRNILSGAVFDIEVELGQLHTPPE